MTELVAAVLPVHGSLSFLADVDRTFLWSTILTKGLESSRTRGRGFSLKAQSLGVCM